MPQGELKTILYVEDEPDIREVAKIALELVGKLSLIICSSGEEALRQAPHSKPDMLLLDVMMPGMDGPTTLRALRRIPSTRTTPAVFMTAKVQLKEIQEYKALGAVEIVAKPFDPMTLAQTLRSIWARCS